MYGVDSFMISLSMFCHICPVSPGIRITMKLSSTSFHNNSSVRWLLFNYIVTFVPSQKKIFANNCER